MKVKRAIMDTVQVTIPAATHSELPKGEVEELDDTAWSFFGDLPEFIENKPEPKFIDIFIQHATGYDDLRGIDL